MKQINRIIFESMNLSDKDMVLLRQFFTGIPVKKAYLFGSYARKEADKDSDIDILVELDHTIPIGLKFFTYQLQLQQLLKTKVDLVSEEGLSKYVRPFVDKDKVLIYERAIN